MPKNYETSRSNYMLFAKLTFIVTILDRFVLISIIRHAGLQLVGSHTFVGAAIPMKPRSAIVFEVPEYSFRWSVHGTLCHAREQSHKRRVVFMSLFLTLWSDESGFIVSAELVLIATVVLIGLIIGLATLRDDMINELADVADAFSELNQSYSLRWHHGALVDMLLSGNLFSDLADFCESGVNVNGEQVPGAYVGCIATQPGVPE